MCNHPRKSKNERKRITMHGINQTKVKCEEDLQYIEGEIDGKNQDLVDDLIYYGNKPDVICFVD